MNYGGRYGIQPFFIEYYSMYYLYLVEFFFAYKLHISFLPPFSVPTLSRNGITDSNHWNQRTPRYASSIVIITLYAVNKIARRCISNQFLSVHVGKVNFFSKKKNKNFVHTRVVRKTLQPNKVRTFATSVCFPVPLLKLKSSFVKIFNIPI